jgi:group I intron endonuclease
MYIYIIENKINGIWYVGKRMQSINSNDFYKYYGSGVRIKKAISELGKDNFTKKILEVCDDKNILADREIFWIKKTLEENKNETYNILLEKNYIGRECGFKQSSEHIKKRVESLKKSGAYIWSEDRRNKFSEYKKTIPIWNKGKKCKSISLSKIGSKNPMARKVIDKSTNVIFDSLVEVSKEYNIKYSTLYQYLCGSRKNKTNLYFL